LDKKLLSRIYESLIQQGFNLALPIVCLSDEEDKYLLLTGLPIYECARKAELEQIWVFLIAEEKDRAEKAIEKFVLQSTANERILDSQDISEFLEFLNSQDSSLTSIRGIGTKYEKKIEDGRPYESLEDMKKKLGPKQPFQWLKAYKDWKSQN
jgi:hypothetical protein